MTTLSRRQQHLLLDTIGVADLASVLVEDDGIARIRDSKHRGTVRHRDPDGGERPPFYRVATRGVELGRIEIEPPEFVPSEVITWAGIRAHCATVPESLLEEIRAALAATRQHLHAYPTFERPADPAEFADAHIAFQRDVAPWAAEMERRFTARKRAVLAAFPAATSGDEPTDLLGFLAQLEAVSA